MSAISIVIITLNEEFNLSNLLDDLIAQTTKSFEVIIVDSNSDDSTVQIAQSYANKFQNFNIIEMLGRGVSLGRNTGADNAQNERLLFLDADARLDPNFIKTSLAVLNEKDIDIGCAYVNSSIDNFLARSAANSINSGMWLTQSFFPTAVGACIFSTKTTHNYIDGFNVNIPMGEDCDYTLRAFKHKSIKYGMVPVKFTFDMRRYEEEGYLRLTIRYTLLNLRRFFIGEYKNGEIEYVFGEHKQPANEE